MRTATALLLLAVGAAAVGRDAPAGVPTIGATVPLSAQPAVLSVGQAGPVNRYAFDVAGLPPGDPVVGVLCLYGARLSYRCAAGIAPLQAGSDRRRVTVAIPDLARGQDVVVRFTNAQGHRDVRIRLANTPQVVHEIEALPLPGGGQATVGSDGAPAPVRQLISHRAGTVPAMATSVLASAPACDQVYAEWVGVSATDPVFASAFGPLNGSVVLVRPPPRGSRVRPDNLPEWLVSFPASATRVQFIAHYEVIYRVGICADKVVAG